MQQYDALTLASTIGYKPDWKLRFKAADFVDRLMLASDTTDSDPQNSDAYIVMNVSYQGFESNNRTRPLHTQQREEFGRTWLVRVDNLYSADDFYAAIFARILATEEHEAREAFHIDRKSGHAPYHPHRRDGELKWRHFGDPARRLADSAAVRI